MSQKDKSNSLSYLFGKTWLYSLENHPRIVCFWVMFIMAECIDLFLPPLVFAKIMNVIQERGITQSSIWFLFELLLSTLVIVFAFWALHGPARLMERNNAFRVRANYRRHLLKGVLTLPSEWHTDHHSGDTIDKIEKGTSALYRFSESSSQVIYAMVDLIGSYLILVYISHSSAYIVLALMLATAWITMRFDKVIVARYKELNHADNRISASVFDAVSNITTVIILRVERLIFTAIMHKVEKPFELYKDTSRLNEFKWFLTNVCCAVMTVIALGVYFWQHVGAVQGILWGSIYLLVEYLKIISHLFFQFTLKYGEILQHKANVMNSEELTADFKEESFTNHVLPTAWKSLNLENLNFSYHGAGKVALHLTNISFRAKKGERIVFVGGSGEGKSTLLKIMRDLYHPQTLTLSVDGQVIPQGFEGIARAIALVPQDPEIFATTILENVTVGAEYDMDFVRQFTDMACFTEVAEGLPKGFDSSIKEKGVNLSVGQKQRLALARGLLACHDKDIILLDEPTSSLDALTEIAVYQNILKGFEGKTIISTVHGLHLLPLFDRICVFDKGQIVGSGTLAELMVSSPKFIALWKAMQRRSQELKEIEEG